MKLFIATVIATIAINAQVDLPGQFVRGMEYRGEPVVTDTFIGLRWECAPRSKTLDETCFAGYDSEVGLVTGP